MEQKEFLNKYMNFLDNSGKKREGLEEQLIKVDSVKQSLLLLREITLEMESDKPNKRKLRR